MARLNIVQKSGKFSLPLPHRVLVNGRLIGILKEKSVAIEMPAGNYRLTIQSMFPFLYTSEIVDVVNGRETTLEFSDRERWWDILFVLDIVLWTLKRFLHLASPWTWIYEIFTNGYFVIWLIYEWRIREHYFNFNIYRNQ